MGDKRITLWKLAMELGLSSFMDLMPYIETLNIDKKTSASQLTAEEAEKIKKLYQAKYPEQKKHEDVFMEDESGDMPAEDIRQQPVLTEADIRTKTEFDYDQMCFKDWTYIPNKDPGYHYYFENTGELFKDPQAKTLVQRRKMEDGYEVIDAKSHGLPAAADGSYRIGDLIALRCPKHLKEARDKEDASKRKEMAKILEGPSSEYAPELGTSPGRMQQAMMAGSVRTESLSASDYAEMMREKKRVQETGRKSFYYKRPW